MRAVITEYFSKYTEDELLSRGEEKIKADLLTALNERLLAVGFSHVVDVGLVSQLQDSALLNGIYRGDSRLAGAGETERPIDYLIVG